MNTLSADGIASDAQVSQYRDAGFVVVEDIFSPRDIARMTEILDELVAAAANVSEHNAVYDLDPSHTPDHPRVRRIKNPFRNHPIFAEMARHPKLLAALTRFLGPDFRLHGSKINLKSADYGATVEWHQDWAFYPHTNDDVLAVGVMLDDMTEDNGPLLIIPGSHTGPTYDHHQDGRFIGAMDPQTCGIDLTRAAQVTGKAGSCSFHHARVIHGSGQNRSGKDRRLLLYQIAAADAWDIRGMEEPTWEEYANTILAGAPTIEPRLVPTPIRLPYPPAEHAGSIYENQSALKNRYFSQ